MATARKVLVDSTVTPFYHCISRCVRRAFLCGAENAHRKQWIEDRLKELAGIFALDVCGYAIMDNHLHVLLRLNLNKAQAWSAEEVVKRWVELCPPRDRYRQPVTVTKAWIAERATEREWVEERRKRLSDLGWFMKSLKEPIARRANHDDQCTGAFWEGRFRSVAVLDEASLLATCAYIDLNPVAAGIAPTPEKSAYTSIKSRVDHCAAQGQLETLATESPNKPKASVEQGNWLLPIEDRRNSNGKGLTGILPGMPLSAYLQLVDWSSRLIRPGKVRVSETVPDILTRLHIDAGSWKATLEKLIGSRKLVGTYFGETHRLNEAASHRGTKFLKNVTGRETPLMSPQ